MCMKVSAISPEASEEVLKRNLFIRYANSFMSVPKDTEPEDKLIKEEIEKPSKMGIETIQESSIFPKQVIDGHTVITA